MAQSLKISVIQSDIIWENIEANLKHYNNLFSGLDPDTEIVVLPEMFSTGFSMNIKNAEKINGKTIEWMKNTAHKNNTVLTGSIIFSENNKIFNRLIWMDPDGSHFFYDKRHLFRMGKEGEYYSQGTNKLIVEHHGWKICPLICYDLRFPVWSRNVEGFDILMYVSNWPSSRKYAWNTLLRARAIENQCYVIGVNRVGVDGNNLDYSGESMFIDPKGQLLNETSSTDTIITRTLNLEILNDFRRQFPVSKDADNFQIII